MVTIKLAHNGVVTRSIIFNKFNIPAFRVFLYVDMFGKPRVLSLLSSRV